MNQLQGKIHFDVKMGRRDGKILHISAIFQLGPKNHFVGLALVSSSMLLALSSLAFSDTILLHTLIVFLRLCALML